MSSEPIERPDDVIHDERRATLFVGKASLVAPVAYIEMMMVAINQHLQSRVGYGWLRFGIDDDEESCSVLISRGIPIHINWPAGFQPFENPNEMVDDIRKNPVADLPDDE